MPSAPAPLAPSPFSPPSQVSGTVAQPASRRPSASRTPSNAGQKLASGAPTAASALSKAPAPPGRAPLPTKQPKANTSAKAAPAQSPLPRLSIPSGITDKIAMSAAAISPQPSAEGPKISMTSKEWVIPPRPKPGRKPATDTPPTKRKAQNRAAQRAFRERRAARVGELEQQLDEQRDGHVKENADLKEKVHGLELDLQSFRSRCMLLENMLDRERQERIRAETQAASLRRRNGDDYYRSQSMSDARHHSHHGPHSQPHSPIYHHQQHPLRHSVSDGRQDQRNFSISQIITPPESLDNSSSGDTVEATLTCGNCSPSGPCACADEVLASAANGCGKCGFGVPCQCLDEITNAVTQTQTQTKDLKRSASPSAGFSNKRHRSSGGTNTVTETDFTAMFSKRSAAAAASATAASVPVVNSQPETSDGEAPTAGFLPLKDQCGFCKEGTYCMCAEAAGIATPALSPAAETLPPISHQTQTPPPSEPDILPPPLAMEMTADGAVKLPRRTPNKKAAAAKTSSPSSTNGGCGSKGPGTCAQCQADPKSGLFCRLMNAKFSREQGGCCGGKGGAGGCCKSQKPASAPVQPEKITLPSLPSLGLSCAEAYQTLSSHRNFEKAADDISSWLPKLKTTTPEATRERNRTSRQAIEVEAASIMSVLKEFDVRFGRECGTNKSTN